MFGSDQRCRTESRQVHSAAPDKLKTKRQNGEKIELSTNKEEIIKCFYAYWFEKECGARI